MIYRLTDKIWWGDKPSIREALGEVKSVINVAHKIRKPYWQNVGKLDWDVWYFRMALPDREIASDDYLSAFSSVLDGIRAGSKFPLLCHCRMGGHRGPTAALFAFWHLNGRTKLMLAEGLLRMEQLKVGSMRLNSHRVYRRTVLDYCERKSS